MFYAGKIVEAPSDGEELKPGQVWVLCEQMFGSRPIALDWVCFGAIRTPSKDSHVVVVVYNEFRFVLCFAMNPAHALWDLLTASGGDKRGFWPSNNQESWLEQHDEKGVRAKLIDGTETPFVRWDELKSLLTSLITAIKAITVMTAWGPSGTPINSASFDALQTGNIDTDKPATYKESW